MFLFASTAESRPTLLKLVLDRVYMFGWMKNSDPQSQRESELKNFEVRLRSPMKNFRARSADFNPLVGKRCPKWSYESSIK